MWKGHNHCWNFIESGFESATYAAETMYNVEESKMRQLERIEENMLRKLFKTGKVVQFISFILNLDTCQQGSKLKQQNLSFPDIF